MVSIYHFGEPSSDKADSRDQSTEESHTTRFRHFTNSSLGQTSSTKRHAFRSSTLSSTYGRQRTDTRATYINEHELEIACWQARIGPRRATHQLTCSICLEIMDPSVWIRPTVSCAHEARVCEPCLAQLIVHAIKVEGLTEILCPDIGCRKEIDYEDVVFCIQNDLALLDHYDQLITQRNMERDPNFVWCQNPVCSRGQIHDGGAASPLVICRYCDARTCFTHRILWHKGLTCRKYNLLVKRSREIRANEEFIEASTKQCPSPTCRRPIEKADGCDHMTCRRPGGCGHEFCWDCLADYGPIRLQGNHRHNPECRHYSGSSSGYEYATAVVATLRAPIRREHVRRPELTPRDSLEDLVRVVPYTQPIITRRPRLTVRDAGRMVLNAETNHVQNRQLVPSGPVTSLLDVWDGLNDPQGNGSRRGAQRRRRGVYFT